MISGTSGKQLNSSTDFRAVFGLNTTDFRERYDALKFIPQLTKELSELIYKRRSKSQQTDIYFTPNDLKKHKSVVSDEQFLQNF